MRKDITVTAESRDSRGKNEARRLRVAGSMPAVVYGGTDGPVAVAVSPKEVSRILNSRTGHNTIFNLSVAGGINTPVMIVDWQFDPIKDSLLHVDLKRIDLTHRIRVKVPVVTQGEPTGVKIQGGIHEIITREIEIECLPDDIPEQFTVDISDLGLNQSIRASDIKLKDAIELISPADQVISHVVSLRAEAEAPAEVAAVAEPEVIKKGKKDEAAPAADAGAKKAPDAGAKKTPDAGAKKK
jgi:large subunit ribosomal protein L25